MSTPPKKINGKVKMADKCYPFAILFIHRDAESTDCKKIGSRVTGVTEKLDHSVLARAVCVVPVKMMESWLLFDVDAIKKAAGNRYSGKIDLPDISRVEKEQQPKKLLHKILQDASGLKGRNLNKFNIEKAVHLVAENITDFSPLRKLSAFKIFESDLKRVVDEYLRSCETVQIS